MVNIQEITQQLEKLLEEIEKTQSLFREARSSENPNFPGKFTELDSELNKVHKLTRWKIKDLKRKAD